jgi:hypothetical protein
MDEALPALGFSSTLKGGLVTFTGAYTGARRLFDLCGQSSTEIEFAVKHNGEKAREYIAQDSNAWCGGTRSGLVSDLSGKKDLTAAKEAKRKLESSGFVSALDLAVAEVIPRRGRIFSDEEGDWMMERKWEITPFMRMVKAKTATNVLDLDVVFDANGGTSAKILDQYGSIIWSVIDILEARGICCRVKYIMDSLNGIRGKSSGSVSSLVEIVVKEPGEYLAPNLMAAVFQTNFFRRLGFVLLVTAADSQKLETTDGLGSARSYQEVIKVSPGKMMLTPGILESGSVAKDIQNKLIECLKQMRR